MSKIYQIFLNIANANNNQSHKAFYLDKEAMSIVLEYARSTYSDTNWCWVHDEPFDILTYDKRLDDEQEHSLLDELYAFMESKFSESKMQEITTCFACNYDYEELMKQYPNQDYIIHNTEW